MPDVPVKRYNVSFSIDAHGLDDLVDILSDMAAKFAQGDGMPHGGTSAAGYGYRVVERSMWVPKAEYRAGLQEWLDATG